MKTHTKITAIASTILLSVCLSGPAQATTTKTDRTIPPLEAVDVPISAPITSALTYDKPTVTTSAAPVVQEVEPAAAVQTVPVVPSAPVTTPAPVQAAPVAPKAAPAPVTATPAPAPAVPSSSRGALLLASAYSQIGITQDCTAMVEHALGSIGIISGDLAPAQFFRFGPVVSIPQPGDILISAGHVGIYAGNGQMISGGFNGSQTVLHPVSYVGAYSAVRVA